jgi:putative acetyltransferase
MERAVTITQERPDQPEVVALLDALDRYLGGLYEPEANHILSVEELLAPSVRFFVARDGGEAVGTGAARLVDDGQGRYGEVKRMYVDPARRGRRIGAQMLARIEAQLRTDGVAEARLETGSAQMEAVKLYRQAGYADCAPFGAYPDNGLSLFMCKAL